MKTKKLKQMLADHREDDELATEDWWWGQAAWGAVDWVLEPPPDEAEPVDLFLTLIMEDGYRARLLQHPTRRQVRQVINALENS